MIFIFIDVYLVIGALLALRCSSEVEADCGLFVTFIIVIVFAIIWPAILIKAIIGGD